MPFRRAPPAAPVTITFDGASLPASRGESVAAAILGAGTLALARSPKFHRPRGPSCMRGACDGCLVRVDGKPNVMACMTPVRDGMAVESQNTLGSREVDLLRVTDWFFPHGVNPHELFAGVPGAQRVMQAFARRAAGLGLLPDEEAAPRRAVRRRLDALVVGSGPAGMAVGAALAERGRAVEVLDDALAPGGGLRALHDGDRAAWREIEDPFRAAVARGGVVVRSSTVAAGFYGAELLVVGESGAEIVTAEDVILAPGAHDGVSLFEGNDVPGVMSARAAGFFLAEGVVVGEHIALVEADTDNGSSAGSAFGRALRGAGLPDPTLVRGPFRVRGASRVRGLVLEEEGGRERTVEADALLVDAPRAPAYELCAQAGARLERESRGFVVRTDAGRIRDRIWATGEVVGTAWRPSAILEDAVRVVRAIASV